MDRRPSRSERDETTTSRRREAASLAPTVTTRGVFLSASRCNRRQPDSRRAELGGLLPFALLQPLRDPMPGRVTRGCPATPRNSAKFSPSSTLSLRLHSVVQTRPVRRRSPPFLTKQNLEIYADYMMDRTGQFVRI